MRAGSGQALTYAAEANFATETLPGWTYCDPAFLALEKEHLFLANWQIVCHASEVRMPGDYATLEFMGERALVLRGADGRLRAFYNVCRHRAAAVLSGETGRCEGAIRCPYHGWTYDLEGRLKAVPAEGSFPKLDKDALGLRPIEIEEFLGFVFVRFRASGPTAAERLAPYAEELRLHRLEEMEPFGGHWRRDLEVDWKNVMDNYLEGYHVPAGHPGLYRLFGTRYEAEVRPGGVSRAMHWLRDRPSSQWSERQYQRLLPDLPHLPPERRRAWSYYTLLPNIAFDVYPDQMDFLQVIPLAAGRCFIRGRSYRLSKPSRPLRAAQYLNQRINRQVQREDEVLVRSVQAGLASESYATGILSDKEICLRQLHDMIRERIPVARLAQRPEGLSLRQLNESLRQH